MCLLQSGWVLGLCHASGGPMLARYGNTHTCQARTHIGRKAHLCKKTCPSSWGLTCWSMKIDSTHMPSMHSKAWWRTCWRLWCLRHPLPCKHANLALIVMTNSRTLDWQHHGLKCMWQNEHARATWLQQRGALLLWPGFGFGTFQFSKTTSNFVWVKMGMHMAPLNTGSILTATNQHDFNVLWLHMHAWSTWNLTTIRWLLLLLLLWLPSCKQASMDELAIKKRQDAQKNLSKLVPGEWMWLTQLRCKLRGWEWQTWWMLARSCYSCHFCNAQHSWSFPIFLRLSPSLNLMIFPASAIASKEGVQGRCARRWSLNMSDHQLTWLSHDHEAWSCFMLALHDHAAIACWGLTSVPPLPVLLRLIPLLLCSAPEALALLLSLKGCLHGLPGSQKLVPPWCSSWWHAWSHMMNLYAKHLFHHDDHHDGMWMHNPFPLSWSWHLTCTWGPYCFSTPFLRPIRFMSSMLVTQPPSWDTSYWMQDSRLSASTCWHHNYSQEAHHDHHLLSCCYHEVHQKLLILSHNHLQYHDYSLSFIIITNHNNNHHHQPSST